MGDGHLLVGALCRASLPGCRERNAKKITMGALATLTLLNLLDLLWDLFLKPIWLLNVEGLAAQEKWDLFVSIAPWMAQVISVIITASGWLYNLLTSGYSLAFVAGCTFLAFFDVLSFPIKMTWRRLRAHERDQIVDKRTLEAFKHLRSSELLGAYLNLKTVLMAVARSKPAPDELDRRWLHFVHHALVEAHNDMLRVLDAALGEPLLTWGRLKRALLEYHNKYITMQNNAVYIYELTPHSQTLTVSGVNFWIMTTSSIGRCYGYQIAVN